MNKGQRSSRMDITIEILQSRPKRTREIPGIHKKDILELETFIKTLILQPHLGLSDQDFECDQNGGTMSLSAVLAFAILNDTEGEFGINDDERFWIRSSLVDLLHVKEERLRRTFHDFAAAVEYCPHEPMSIFYRTLVDRHLSLALQSFPYELILGPNDCPPDMHFPSNVPARRAIASPPVSPVRRSPRRKRPADENTTPSTVGRTPRSLRFTEPSRDEDD